MTIVDSTNTRENDIYLTSWTPLVDASSGSPLNLAYYADKTMQIFGTFGSGGSLTMQGSNDPRVISDPTNAIWFSLVDPQGNAITKTAAGGEAILENPHYIRPLVTAGDVTTSLTVIICSRR